MSNKTQSFHLKNETHFISLARTFGQLLIPLIDKNSGNRLTIALYGDSGSGKTNFAAHALTEIPHSPQEDVFFAYSHNNYGECDKTRYKQTSFIDETSSCFLIDCGHSFYPNRKIRTQFSLTDAFKHALNELTLPTGNKSGLTAYEHPSLPLLRTADLLVCIGAFCDNAVNYFNSLHTVVGEALDDPSLSEPCLTTTHLAAEAMTNNLIKKALFKDPKSLQNERLVTILALSDDKIVQACFSKIINKYAPRTSEVGLAVT